MKTKVNILYIYFILFLQEFEPKWPEAYWDDWIREPNQVIPPPLGMQ